MDPIDEMKMILYRIGIAKSNFLWKKSKDGPPGTTAYEGTLGPVHIMVLRFKIDGIQLLGIPHNGYGYEGVIRTGLNVVRMPNEMAEEFFNQAVQQLSPPP